MKFSFMISWKLEDWNERMLPNTSGQFHRAAKQNKLLSRFSWLPAKLACKMNVLWLVDCFIMLSEIYLLSKLLCLACSLNLAPVLYLSLDAVYLKRNICLKEEQPPLILDAALVKHHCVYAFLIDNQVKKKNQPAKRSQLNPNSLKHCYWTIKLLQNSPTAFIV